MLTFNPLQKPRRNGYSATENSRCSEARVLSGAPRIFVMMFAYDFEPLNTFLKKVLKKNLTPDAWTWLEEAGKSAATHDGISKFNIAFVAAPRKTGKNCPMARRNTASASRCLLRK